MPADARLAGDIARNVTEGIRTEEDLKECSCAECKAALHILRERKRIRPIDRVLNYAQEHGGDFTLMDLRRAMPNEHAGVLSNKLAHLVRQRRLTCRQSDQPGRKVNMYRIAGGGP
jgi:hypothetical protein